MQNFFEQAAPQKKSHPVLAIKQRHSQFGYRRIAIQIANDFEVAIDKDVVRRILANRYQPTSKGDGPSWLTFIGQLKDSPWSLDLFRAESIHLKSHWVRVIMDQFSRKMIGFAVHPGILDGTTICSIRLFQGNHCQNI